MQQPTNGLSQFVAQQLKLRNLVLLVIPLSLLALLIFGRADSDRGTAPTGDSQDVQQLTIKDDADDQVGTSTQIEEQGSSQSISEAQPVDGEAQSSSETVLLPQVEIKVNQTLVNASAPSSSIDSSAQPSNTVIDLSADDVTASDITEVEIDRIVIPAINLDTDVTELGWHTKEDESGQIFSEWDFANNSAGWHKNSARPGEGGNVVMSGHNNILGAVFRELDQLDQGDEAFVYSGDRVFTYEIERVMVVPEVYADPEQRADNAKWIEQFDDDRLTLVSCWPRDDNSHRIIVIGHAVEG